MNKGVIGLVAGVVIVVVIFGIFMFSSSNDNTLTDTNVNSLINQPSAESGAGPKEVYLAYHKEFDQMKNFDDYITLTKKYAPGEVIDKLSQFDSYTKELKTATFTLVKSLSPKTSDFTNVQETITGDSAILSISTSDPKSTGSIKLKKENGVWKVMNENWSQAV